MTIALHTNDPDVTSEFTTLEFTSGNQVTVHGIRDLSGTLAIRVSPQSAQTLPSSAFSLRETLRKQAIAVYTKVKNSRQHRSYLQGIDSATVLAMVRQANANGFTVLIDSSSVQGEVQEGESAVAYLMGCEFIAVPLGTILHIK